jgi:hypothetical protein
MISRRGPEGGGFVGARGDNVYAGRDGNVYRRDQGGNWQKWDNGSWNSPNRPTQNNAARDSMLNDRARQTERQTRDNAARGDRAGQSTSRSTQMDRSTRSNLNRDRAARMNGHNVTATIGTYNRSGGEPGKLSRGKVFREDGGGFRGGRSSVAEESKGPSLPSEVSYPPAQRPRSPTTSFVRDIANQSGSRPALS